MMSYLVKPLRDQVEHAFRGGETTSYATMRTRSSAIKRLAIGSSDMRRRRDRRLHRVWAVVHQQ